MQHSGFNERSVKRAFKSFQRLILTLRILALEGPLTLNSVAYRVSKVLNEKLSTVKSCIYRDLEELQKYRILEVKKVKVKGREEYSLDIGPKGILILYRYDRYWLAPYKALERKGYILSDLVDFMQEIAPKRYLKDLEEYKDKPPEISEYHIPSLLYYLQRDIEWPFIRGYENVYYTIVGDELEGVTGLLNVFLLGPINPYFEIMYQLVEKPMMDLRKYFKNKYGVEVRDAKEEYEKEIKEHLTRIREAVKKLKPATRTLLIHMIEKSVRYHTITVDAYKTIKNIIGRSS